MTGLLKIFDTQNGNKKKSEERRRPTIKCEMLSNCMNHWMYHCMYENKNFNQIKML